MVLTALRNGQDSDEWRAALKLVDEILWSVIPKTSAEERKQLTEKLPQLYQEIREGLNLIGDPEINSNSLLEELSAYHRELMEMPPEKAAAIRRPESAKDLATPKAPTAAASKATPKPIWEDVEVELPEDREQPFLKSADPVLLGIVDHLRSVKLGTSFEFNEPKRNIQFRAKLSWYSPKTSYYIFVNQAGIQVAVKSLRTLAKELHLGQTRIVPQARKPFVERAMESIHSLVAAKQEGPDHHAGTPTTRSSYPSSYQ
jgi:hypothetical protein